MRTAIKKIGRNLQIFKFNEKLQITVPPKQPVFERIGKFNFKSSHPKD